MNKSHTQDPIVFVIDDDPEILNALRWLLESIQLNVQCFESASEFLQNYDPSSCGCIVTDIRMPVISGMRLLEQLNTAKCNLPVIVVTGHGDIPMAVKAMKMGVVDFISKPFNDQYLLEQIQKAIAENLKSNAFEEEKDQLMQNLSRREKEIMNLIADGKLNKQIAQELHISISTVEFHRSRLMKKTGAKNLAHLIKIYLGIKEVEGLA